MELFAALGHRCQSIRDEGGQALIFAAIVMPALILAMGVAVMGAYTVNTYRNMQAAADLAALAGAQGLPCGNTDTACLNAVEQHACQYAVSNGYGDCAPGAMTGSSANVPPVSCSPYDFLNYGNAGVNPNCKSSVNAVTMYAYIEVRLTRVIPVFPLLPSVTLSAHAVARHGQVSPKRFAIITLDPTQSKALTFSGSQGGGMVTVGPVVSDSTASDSIYTGGQSTQTACSGEWYTAAMETPPPAGPAANLTSDTGGATSFAPGVCVGGTTDSPTQFLNGIPPVPDPYAGGVAPPTVTGGMTNCQPCNSVAQYYTWSTGNRLGGTWGSAASLPNIGNSTNIELFPGIYPNGITVTGGNIYLNPGVYTIQHGFSDNGGTICIYGAPACDAQVNKVNSGANCSTASFRQGDATYVPSGQWYYYCSPWGIWDSSLLPGRTEPLTAPTFTDGGLPLNGVTFYLASGNFTLNGNGASYLAYPNPCAGTGLFNAVSSAVDFPSGSAIGLYTYPLTALPRIGGTLSSLLVYPNADMGFGAECAEVQPPTDRMVWPGEMAAGSTHLHFLIWARSPTSAISLNGTGLQNWFGIIYNPGAAGCGTACNIQINGNGGAGTGPPLLTGQVIGDNATFGGNGTYEVFYSPCRPDGDICSVGYGTSLVE